MVDLKKEVEAILFSAGRAVQLNELQALLHMKDAGLIKETIRELKEDYESKDSPLMILSEDEGWKLTVKEKFLPIVQKINPHTELSKTILETLSVIAWKQPVLQSEVIKIRTNKAYDHIAELDRLGFVSKDRHGRSYMLKVTQKFLDYFDLPDEKTIKETFKEFKDIEVAVQKKAGSLEKEKAQEGDEMKKEEEKLSSESEKGLETPKESQKEKKETKEEEIELEPYIDVPPPMKKPGKGVELEVYDVPKEEVEAEAEEEKAKEGEPEKAEEEEAKKETPEEKARRIARELIGEEPPKTPKAEEAEERKLHPKLEEFVAGAAKQAGPKEEGKPEEKKEEKPEAPPAEEKPKEEKPAEEPAPEEQEPPTEEEKPEAAGPGKEVVAEEYPGQFSKEQKGEKQGEEEPEKK